MRCLTMPEIRRWDAAYFNVSSRHFCSRSTSFPSALEVFHAYALYKFTIDIDIDMIIDWAYLLTTNSSRSRVKSTLKNSKRGSLANTSSSTTTTPIITQQIPTQRQHQRSTTFSSLMPNTHRRRDETVLSRWHRR